jgi:hypothetical protein
MLCDYFLNVRHLASKKSSPLNYIFQAPTKFLTPINSLPLPIFGFFPTSNRKIFEPSNYSTRKESWKFWNITRKYWLNSLPSSLSFSKNSVKKNFYNQIKTLSKKSPGNPGKSPQILA